MTRQYLNFRYYKTSYHYDLLLCYSFEMFSANWQCRTFAYIIHCVAIAKCLRKDTLLPLHFSGTVWIITLETTICVKDLRNLKRSAYTAFKMSTSPYPIQWPKQRDRTALSFISTCYGFENTNQLMAYSIVFIDVDYLHLFSSLSLSLSLSTSLIISHNQFVFWHVFPFFLPFMHFTIVLLDSHCIYGIWRH